MAKLCEIFRVWMFTWMIPCSLSEVQLLLEPAKEGFPHFLYITGTLIPQDVLEVYLLKGEDVILFCYLPSECEVTFDKEYNVTTSLNHENFNLTLTIRNVTKTGPYSSEGHWTLITEDKINGRKRKTFYLPVYDHVSLLANKLATVCDYNTDRGLTVMCTTNSTYPQTKCAFSVKLNNKMTDILPDHIEYQQEDLDSVSLLYKSSCIFRKNDFYTPDVFYEVNIMIYPNLTNKDSDMLYGENISIHFLIDEPVVLYLSDEQTFHYLAPVVIGSVVLLTIIALSVCVVKCKILQSVHVFEQAPSHIYATILETNRPSNYVNMKPPNSQKEYKYDHT